MPSVISTDVLIVGAGVAGLWPACVAKASPQLWSSAKVWAAGRV